MVGTNDLTQYTHAADRELASAEHYYRPASSAMKKLITMVLDAAKVRNVPVTICGLAVGNPANTVQYLQLGLRSFSVSPQNLLNVKKALLELCRSKPFLTQQPGTICGSFRAVFSAAAKAFSLPFFYRTHEKTGGSKRFVQNKDCALLQKCYTLNV